MSQIPNLFFPCPTLIFALKILLRTSNLYNTTGSTKQHVSKDINCPTEIKRTTHIFGHTV